MIRYRLSRLYVPNMEETVSAILASLGKIDRPFLTPLEEKLLAVLEDSETATRVEQS